LVEPVKASVPVEKYMISIGLSATYWDIDIPSLAKAVFKEVKLSPY
jgi:hypothetical protein